MEQIFAYAAPRMRLMRKLLKLNPELVEEVEFLDFLYAIQRLHSDDNDTFLLRFPHVETNNVLRTVTFDEDVRKGYPLPTLKKWVEDVLKTDKKCAVSILFNQHIATGCFDSKVEI